MQPNAQELADTIRKFTALSENETADRFQAMWSGNQSACQELIEGNMHWVHRLAEHLSKQSNIPLDELLDAGKKGLENAIRHYSDPKHRFCPEETWTGGYAIWWVRLEFLRLAKVHGYEYSAAANTLTLIK